MGNPPRSGSTALGLVRWQTMEAVFAIIANLFQWFSMVLDSLIAHATKDKSKENDRKQYWNILAIFWSFMGRCV